MFLYSTVVIRLKGVVSLTLRGDTNLKTTSYCADSYNLFTFSSPVIPELYMKHSVLEIHQLGLGTPQPLFSLF